MANEVQIPDFNFAAFYYADILDALIQYRRIYAPEISDENEFEPYVQLERAFSLVGHLNNILLDFTAKESLLPTATLRSSVRNILKLIGYELGETTPAVADLVLELSKVFTADVLLIPERSQFATKFESGVDPAIYENIEEYNLTRTDRPTRVFAVEDDVFTDYTVESYTPASFFTPWATPVAGDLLLIGHDSALWDKIGIELNTAASGITGVWEFYDGTWADDKPDAVIDQGSTLRFELNSLLGTVDRSGATVRVTLIATNQFEEVISQWDGSKNYIESGLLGQSSPSTTPDDYSIGIAWHPLEAADGSSDFQNDGDVDYDLPQSLLKDWIKATLNGHEAFWIRYRIISVSTPTAPSIDLTTIDEGKQYVLTLITQGQTILGEVLGSSTGQANQSFTTVRDTVIQASQIVYVDAEAWSEVTNFLNSTLLDKHYLFEVDDDTFGVIDFGDGVNGKIPPIGVDNVTIDYRIGADQDGNVAHDTINTNRSGIAFINRLFNPRPAIGWRARRGNDAEDLERVKVEGPASIRTLERATSAPDVEDLTIAFIAADGSNPVSRAQAVEEQFGVKTVGVIVVGTGGGFVPSGKKTEIENYFNGNEAAGVKGVIVLNHQATLVDYAQKTIDVTATVFGGNQTLIENVLTALLQPEAKTADGLRFEWEFGEEVPRSRLISEIFTVAGVRKVDMTIPAGDTALQTNELPIVGTLNITVEP